MIAELVTIEQRNALDIFTDEKALDPYLSRIRHKMAAVKREASIHALCTHVGIARSEWDKWCDKLGDQCAQVRVVVEKA